MIYILLTIIGECFICEQKVYNEPIVQKTVFKQNQKVINNIIMPPVLPAIDFNKFPEPNQLPKPERRYFRFDDNMPKLPLRQPQKSQEEIVDYSEIQKHGFFYQNIITKGDKSIQNNYIQGLKNDQNVNIYNNHNNLYGR